MAEYKKAYTCLNLSQKQFLNYRWNYVHYTERAILQK